MKWQVPLAVGALLASGQWALAAQSPSVGKIQHIVVIFQENVAFDHYFATYPKAANPPGEPAFHARPHTPKIDGLSGKLLTANPNFLNKANGPGAVNPFRLDRSEAATADQNHAYTPEQKAFDHGRMDLFPEFTGRNGPPPGTPGPNPRSHTVGKGLAMGYFDGNTVTAMWNYAQHYALEQRSFGTTFGPSTVGALNLVSGQTNGVIETINGSQNVIDGGAGSLTDIADPNPLGDVCSPSSGQQIAMGGHNIGNLLDASKISWGWFQGGFDLDLTNSNGTTGCERSTHSAVTIKTPRDYVPHHDPFQYYASTANSQHVRPAATAEIGHDGPANHNYDVEDFYTAVKAGDFPSVSFIKAPAYANGHAGNSDPIDEQHFVVHLMNFLEQQPQWDSTAVIIAYDDSDGWYDHVAPPIVNGSSGNSDAYTAPGVCGSGVPALAGIDATNPRAEGRCGYGPRLPLLVVSPWAKLNYVSSVTTDQTSILRLIEDTFLHGQRLGHGSFDTLSGSLDPMFDFSHATPRNTKLLILDEVTGEVADANIR
jgi:phospholipase C